MRCRGQLAVDFVCCFARVVRVLADLAWRLPLNDQRTYPVTATRLRRASFILLQMRLLIAALAFKGVRMSDNQFQAICARSDKGQH